MIYINVPTRIPGFDYNRTALVDKSCNSNVESYILHELDPENNGYELVINRTGNRKKLMSIQPRFIGSRNNESYMKVKYLLYLPETDMWRYNDEPVKSLSYEGRYNSGFSEETNSKIMMAIHKLKKNKKVKIR